MWSVHQDNVKKMQRGWVVLYDCYEWCISRKMCLESKKHSVLVLTTHSKVLSDQIENRAFIDVFSRRAKRFELLFFITKAFHRLSNQPGIIILTASQFAWCPALNQTSVNIVAFKRFFQTQYSWDISLLCSYIINEFISTYRFDIQNSKQCIQDPPPSLL